MNVTAIRHMTKADLGVCVELERQANLNLFTIPGIGECQALEPFAWRECDFLAAIRQYKSRSRGTNDTRALVAVATGNILDELSGTKVPLELVAGSMVYEIQDDGFEILRLSAVPADDTTRQLFIDHLLEACAKSTKRHSVRCYISDGDWETLRFFVRLGWQRKLLPSYFLDGRDGWLVQATVVAAPPPRRDLAAGA